MPVSLLNAMSVPQSFLSLLKCEVSSHSWDNGSISKERTLDAENCHQNLLNIHITLADVPQKTKKIKKSWPYLGKIDYLDLKYPSSNNVLVYIAEKLLSFYDLYTKSMCSSIYR